MQDDMQIDGGLDASADLETVLEAWHDATVRLEQTHEALRSEVHRLTSCCRASCVRCRRSVASFQASRMARKSGCSATGRRADARE